VLADNPAPAPASSNPNGTMVGFDTCTAPSMTAMTAWRAKYSAVGIYIGGQMMGCGQANLSASWVQQTEAMGWSLMPTFVGLQAPCNTFSGKINPNQAASQGTAAANQAIGDATTYGLGSGSPIYYDMEAYNHTNAGCRTAVLTFLDAWTRQIEAQGYVSGVYSSADAAIIDLQSTTTIAGHPLAEPQAIWFALWDNANNLTGAPYMNTAVWPLANRSKQYAGNRVVSVGGISLDIDPDLVASAVARG
jgi:glycoside hydrolase-like protein